MLQPVFTAPIFAVHGLLDGARGKGLAYLDTLLEAEPQDPVLLWYRGVALFSLERRQDAHATWLTLQSILPPHGENAELVRDALDRARQ